ncbi:MAG: hypothetical protein ACRD6W_18515 [Nitrososphaerales archaeon]
MSKSGGAFTTPALAREHGLTDVDGTQQSQFWTRHWGAGPRGRAVVKTSAVRPIMATREPGGDGPRAA